MAASDRLTTTVSTKGQVILPKTIRAQRHWDAGTRLVVEDTPAGVLLRAAPVFTPTRGEEVFASLRYQGKPKTLAEMETGIAVEAKRRHACDRY
jgi:AbrB family looped-hinge helix DNA binding protein